MANREIDSPEVVAKIAAALVIPPYLAGRYYSPPRQTLIGGAAVASAGTIHFSSLPILHRCTIDTLGVAITTAAAGGNFQIALYSRDPSNGDLTLLRATGSASTAATGVVNATLTSPLPVTPGIYVIGFSLDNTTAVAAGRPTNNTDHSATFGCSTAALVGGSAVNNCQTYAGTFGTWPTPIALGSLTDASTVRVPAVQFHVSSVP
jgi:hypothetical protein